MFTTIEEQIRVATTSEFGDLPASEAVELANQWPELVAGNEYLDAQPDVALRLAMRHYGGRAALIAAKNPSIVRVSEAVEVLLRDDILITALAGNDGIDETTALRIAKTNRWALLALASNPSAWSREIVAFFRDDPIVWDRYCSFMQS